MNEKEKQFSKRRIMGIALGLVGFSVSTSVIYFEKNPGGIEPRLLVFSGCALALVGPVIYLRAFFQALKYARSEEYKNSLKANHPWEEKGAND